MRAERPAESLRVRDADRQRPGEARSRLVDAAAATRIVEGRYSTSRNSSNGSPPPRLGRPRTCGRAEISRLRLHGISTRPRRRRDPPIRHHPRRYEHLNRRVPDEVKFVLHVLLVEHGKTNRHRAALQRTDPRYLLFVVGNSGPDRPSGYRPSICRWKFGSGPTEWLPPRRCAKNGKLQKPEAEVLVCPLHELGMY